MKASPRTTARAHPAPEYGDGAPDPRALALAGALQDRLPDARVLLFGSRATGAWTPGSDIDLAVIGGAKPAAKGNRRFVTHEHAARWRQ